MKMPELDVAGTLGTAFSGVTSDVMSTITTVLPFALAIVGAVLAIRIGIRFFKSVAK